MANIQFTSLDFTDIKSNFSTFLQSQSTFKDYNFAGAGLSVLTDLLAYNTMYNAYYLNMVGNEMFLDTAIQRSSIVSHAKMLNYVPLSSIASTAVISMNVYNVSTSTLTLPQYTNFISQAVGATNFNFVNTDPITVNVTNNTATFSNITLKQGSAFTYTYTVSSVTNPTYTFEIPDPDVDTTTMRVLVYQSSSNTNYTEYVLAQNYLNLNANSNIYFLQEGLNGNYQLTFGDGILGSQLTDGNVIRVSYVSTQGDMSTGANSFSLLDNLSGFSNNSIQSVVSSNGGSGKETTDSIKYNAPKAFAAQNRAVTKDDYATLIQQNNLGYALDAVSVWGGDTLNPPQFGKVFVSIKPTGAYTLTTAQKNYLTEKVIKPISVMTVTPVIVDPDYTYVILNANIIYDSKKTTLTGAQITTQATNIITNYCAANLNKFNTTFVSSDIQTQISNIDNSIVGVELDLFLQKRVPLLLNQTQTYVTNFGQVLKNSTGAEVVTITPSFSTYDLNGTYYPNVYIEESPDNTTNIDSVTVINGGYGYTSPIVTISGDGQGAIAHAVVVNGIITGIIVDSGGIGYTQAIVIISDSTGTGASAYVNLKGNYSYLRSYYFDAKGIKNILSGYSHVNNVGNVDFTNGIVALTNLFAVSVNSLDGNLRINAPSLYRTITTTQNNILTLDVNDNSAITVNVTTL